MGTWTGSLANPAGVKSALAVELHRRDYLGNWFSKRPDSGGADVESVATYCAEDGKRWRYQVTGNVDAWRDKTVRLMLDPALPPRPSGYRLAKQLHLAWREGSVLEATARWNC